MADKIRYEVKVEDQRGEEKTIKIEVEKGTKGLFFQEDVYRVYLVKSGIFFDEREELGEIKDLSQLKSFLETALGVKVKRLKTLS